MYFQNGILVQEKIGGEILYKMATVTDVNLVFTQEIEKFPYCPEYADAMPSEYHSYYSNSPEKELLPSDWEFTDPYDAIKKFYQNSLPPFPIQPFDTLLGQIVTGIDGIDRKIDCEEAYFHHYGLQMCDLYWVRFSTKCAAVCSTWEETETFLHNYADQLKKPRVITTKFSVLLNTLEK